MSRRLKPANNWGKAWNVLLRSAVLFLFLGCGHAFADLSPDTYGCACSGDHSGLGSEEDVPTGSGSATADSDLELRKIALLTVAIRNIQIKRRLNPSKRHLK